MHLTSHTQRSSAAALGLRIPRPEKPAVAWLPWQVVDRDGGCFHVSREAASGAHVPEALKNEVGRVKVFRKRETAQAACDGANGIEPHFRMAGGVYTRAQMLAGNTDAPEVCAWVRRARPGDVYEQMHAERVECVSGAAS